MDDVRQCTRCHDYKWNHDIGAANCPGFEYKPFHVMDENGNIHDFAISQEAIAFAHARNP